MISSIGHVYAITHIASGKQYVGSTIRLKDRFAWHKRQLNRDKHHCIKLQRAWNKHGQDAFNFTVLEQVEIGNDIHSREEYWMMVLKPIYNSVLSAIGPRGYKHTEEAKAKIGAASRALVRTELHRKRMSEAQLGKRKGISLSAEHRAKLSVAQRKRYSEKINAI